MHPGRAAEGPLHGELGWGPGSRSVSAQLLASPLPESHLGRNKGLDRKPVRSIPSLMQQDMCGLAFTYPTFIHTHVHTRSLSNGKPTGPTVFGFRAFIANRTSEV